MSIVLISKNQAGNNSRLIESLLQATSSFPSVEVILVDSNSTDETVEFASRYPINVVRLRPGHRLSPAAGRYIGYKRVLFAIRCIEAQQELDEIATKLNLSASRLRHLFKEQTGWSLGQFSKELKLQKAKRILQETFRTVKETAAIAGFSDVSHFVRDYKSRFGCRPSETPFRPQSELAKSAKK